jgi:hypothetical protein
VALQEKGKVVIRTKKENGRVNYMAKKSKQNMVQEKSV